MNFKQFNISDINFSKIIERLPEVCQWSGFVSIVCLMVFPIFSLSVVPLFCLISWALGLVAASIEFPISSKYIKESLYEGYVVKIKNPLCRASIYGFGSLILMTSSGIGFSMTVFSSILLFITGVLYFLLAAKGGADEHKGYFIKQLECSEGETSESSV